jgi:hypothetical protein
MHDACQCSICHIQFCAITQLILLEVRAELDNVNSIRLPKGTTYTLTVCTGDVHNSHNCARCTISAVAKHVTGLARMQVKNSSGEDTREGVEVIAVDANSSLHVDSWADSSLVCGQPLSDACMRDFKRSVRGLQVI